MEECQEEPQLTISAKQLYTDITIKPIYVIVESGKEYDFEGIICETDDTFYDFHFIVNTLYKFFGYEFCYNLNFIENGTKIKIQTMTAEEMNILKEIHEDTFDYPVKYGQAQLKFELC
jgi:hypothetical protein